MFAELLRKRSSGLADLSPGQIAALQMHYELMLRWNKALNLTKITEVVEAVERHYIESLFLGAHLPSGRLRIADIGSGPGFPGIPVAVLRPDCEVFLIEGHKRKAVFLRECTRELNNVKVFAKRAEDLSESFDCAISRAVTYADLRATICRFSSSAALLTGLESPPADWDWNWEEPMAVPGGDRRFLRLGSSGKRSESFT